MINWNDKFTEDTSHILKTNCHIQDRHQRSCQTFWSVWRFSDDWYCQRPDSSLLEKVHYDELVNHLFTHFWLLVKEYPLQSVKPTFDYIQHRRLPQEKSNNICRRSRILSGWAIVEDKDVVPIEGRHKRIKNILIYAHCTVIHIKYTNSPTFCQGFNTGVLLYNLTRFGGIVRI